MKKAVDFVFSTDRHPAEKGGPLERTKEVLQQEEDRSIDELTNNHLVRHRLKILEKLTQDMIDSYADGDAGRVDTVVVEVATELKEFSGKKAKEIKAEIEGKLKHFQTAVTHLEKEGVSNINGSLIRKCRIAMDQNWTCPFTGQQFDAHDLSYMEREHIIPRSIMQTDAMYALVLTFPEVNRMKGKRTALRFIEENQGAIVSERENLSILTSRGYKALVDKLSTKGHPQDTARMRKRKQLLMVMDMDSRETGFTEGSLTQTSHLVRLSARQLCKNLPAIQPHDVISFPGQVTAVVRKAWDLTGCLDAPNVCGDETKGKTKTEIRSITHLHHAVDAITLAYASHYFPKNTSWNGPMQPGALWRAMVARNPNQEQAHLLKSSPLFRLRKSRNGSNRFEVEDIPQALKKQATQRLSEKRVVQHIPADMHGVEAEQNTWRVLNIEGDPSDLSTEVTLRQHTVTDVKNGIRIRKCKTVTEKAGKLLGLLPKSGKGKLKDLKGALVIKTNYGLSLDPEPTIIPFHKVWHRIQELKACNDGKHPRILRRGQIIKIQGYNSKRDGIWKIHSVKASLTVDLARPELTKVKSKGNGSWREVSINSLLQKQCLYFTINNLTGTQM